MALHLGNSAGTVGGREGTTLTGTQHTLNITVQLLSDGGNVIDHCLYKRKYSKKNKYVGSSKKILIDQKINK